MFARVRTQLLLVPVLALAATLLPAQAAGATTLPTSVTGSLSASEVTYGDNLAFRGTVAPLLTEQRTAQLYRINADGSYTMVTERKVSLAGTYSLPVPTNRLGRTSWFVWIPATKNYQAVGTRADSVEVVRAVSRISQTWAGLNSRVGRHAKVTGRVTATAGKRRKVELQMRLGSGWRRMSSGWTDSAGRYTLTLPTGWYHRQQVRVVAPKTAGASRAISRVARQNVSPAYLPLGRKTEWTRIDRKLDMRWDPCRTIVWRFNGARAPRGALADTRKALQEIRRATGLRFRYAGKTRVIPGTSKSWPKGTHVVIAFVHPRQSKWSLRGSTAGQAGPTKLTAGRDAGGAMWRIVRGGAVIDAGQRMPAGFGRGGSRGRILMHEIAHVVGLGHVHSRFQIMASSANSPLPTRWGAGDLAGLSQLGLAQGCVR